MATIWMLGEALIDFVPIQDDQGQSFTPHPGGSPYNAAKAAAKAGAKAGFLGAISNDLFGEMLMNDLEAHAVSTAQAPRSDAPSTLAFVALQNGNARYAFFNNASATATMRPDTGALTFAPGDVLSCGSISLIDNPGADAIATFCQAQSDDVLLCLDPNARPGMIQDLTAWRARITKLSERSGLIKLSDEDLDAIAPGHSPDDYAKERLQARASVVLYTVGDRGVHGYCNAGQVHVRARQTDVVDTVGAGDTLMGAFLSELAQRGLTLPGALAEIGLDALEDILRFAVTAASLNCEKAGCKPPPRQEILHALAAET